MNVYTTVLDRPLVLSVCLPKLAASCKAGGADLVILDEGSTNEETLALIQKYADTVHRRDEPSGARSAMVEEAKLAITNPYWLHVDCDFLVGESFVGDVLNAAKFLGFRLASALVTMGFRKAPVPDSEVRVGKFQFHMYETGRGFLLDGARLFFSDAVKLAGGPEAMTRGTAAIAKRSGLPLALIRPQLPVQHLGIGAAAGFWHNEQNAPSKWVRHLAVDPGSGKPIPVPGFDGDAWTGAALAGEESLKKYVKDGHLDHLARKHLPVEVLRTGNFEEAKERVIQAHTTGRRLLILWVNHWAGDRTRRALGINVDDPIVRACPQTYNHPWLT